MAEIIFPAPPRALDANGNPVGAAEAYFFRTDTTTPLTVYSDSAATTPHPSPLVADANGVFAPVFSDGTYGVKVDVRDPDTDASLPGYPINLSFVSSTATGAASSVSFSPTENIAQTNVQAAIVQVDANWRAAKTGLDADIVSGTAGTAGNLAQWNADGDLVDGPAVINSSSGTSTTAPMSQAAAKAYTETRATAWVSLSIVATTSGTTIDFTSIPAGVTEIEIRFVGVSISSTDHVLVQIGTGGAPTTSGYTGGSALAGSTVRVPASAGFPIYSNSASNVLSGRMSFVLVESNNWSADHSVAVGTDGISATGGGQVTLAGALDMVRLTSVAGSQTFDAGKVLVRYRL